MKRIYIYVFIMIVLVFCFYNKAVFASDNTAAQITNKYGTISISPEGVYTVNYQGKVATYNKVRTFVMFNNNPYFDLDDGRIMKWNTLISKDSYGLRKIWDKLYFFKQYGEGAELISVSLFVIDKTEKPKEIKITEKGNETVFEEYGIIGDHFIIDYTDRKNGKPGFCIVESSGKIQKCTLW